MSKKQLSQLIGKTITNAHEVNLEREADKLVLEFSDGTGCLIETSEWISNVTMLEKETN